ncbi:MAG: DNA methyltransferase, partial [Planctomycetes bacterium]|nr:DNA methyltransferase [Planctomycetota bacterium]
MEVRTEPKTNAVANAMRIEDRSAHDWYRFVLSFPPHLVREYVDRFGLGGGHRVLDPFCGTGTTLVECKKLGVPSVGIESNPAASFASRVKVRWNVDPRGLVRHASEMADAALSRLREEGIDDAANGPLYQAKRHAPLRRLPDDAADLLLANSISPRPLHKVLVLLDALNERRDDRFIDHERLALAKAMVYGISNLHFGPEVGVKPPKPDATVVAAWMNEVRAIAEDLGLLRESAGIESVVHQGDAREIGDLLPPRSVDAVITSPPYPNEKDYTRT